VEIVLIETGDLLQPLDIEQGEPTRTLVAASAPSSTRPPPPQQDLRRHTARDGGIGRLQCKSFLLIPLRRSLAADWPLRTS
jgi:hypothetical protein